RRCPEEPNPVTEATVRERADATAGLAVHWQALDQKLADYLSPEARSKVERAFRLGAAAHHGQTRKSGEPYITHPLAVAGILADMRIDADGLCAAILHDTLEDTPV